MKLVGTVTLAVPNEDNRVVTNTVDLGGNATAQFVQHSLHQMLGQLVNTLPMIAGSTFISLTVASAE